MRSKKSIQLPCAVIALAIMLLCLCGVFTFPVRITCGQLNHTCATAPNPLTGEYRLYYEWEPLAVTALETLTGENYGIFYASGYDEIQAIP